MIAYVFAGQGAQSPGMGDELVAASSEALRIYQQASELLETDLLRLDASELEKTEYAQPAIVVRSLAEWFASPRPESGNDLLAGFSLGEYTALGAAGILELDDLLRLVERRATLMQEAAEAAPGAMAAVLGMDDAAVENVLADHFPDTVFPVNYNAPGQIVISGLADDVDACSRLLSERGARRVMPLRVKAACHTPLMTNAARQLAEFARTLPFKSSRWTLYGNADASTIPDGVDWPVYLEQHMVRPVHWSDEVRQMAADGADRFIEIGPGKVLTGLIRKVLPGAAVG